MAAIALLAAALLAQAAGPAITVEAQTERMDVGYSELMAGQPRAAIERIRANRSLSADDPAALINLGTAHARLGHRDEARNFYRAAIASSDRYDLQLADGSWVDSRRAGHMALDMLQRGGTLALR